MAGQQFVFAEAIVGMKRAVARYDASDEDDSAAEIARSVQHKLKRKAPRSHSILDNGRFIYKKPKIDHAGYQRHIIARNPPLIDEDGDEIEDIDDDESIDGSLAEDNPAD
ncbi:putative rxt2-like protein [Diplodia seriata]|uniref:Putative rxt2-like protein n=1 Tax=Diplodia seriata TaxID=420778 RepID=A0A0G2DZ40_9PEZI|nr:putative rxt2-like protein [Diplodia seriata]